MNTIKFNEPGGFPLETEILDAMQDSYNIFQAFGELAGDKSIIKGCKTTGNNVGDGVVYLEGEIYIFKGGTKQDNVVIVSETTNGNFEDGQSRPINAKKYITFGNTSGAISWSDFKRVYPLTSALYIGKVEMFHGNLTDIPAGFYLCNGDNGTADLRGKFVPGLDPENPDYNAIGKTGGSTQINITQTNLPNLTVSASGLKTTIKNLIGKYIGKSGNGYPDSAGDNTTTGSIHSYARHTEQLSIPQLDITGYLTINGGGQPIDTRPPYYTLAYIEFRGI